MIMILYMNIKDLSGSRATRIYSFVRWAGHLTYEAEMRGVERNHKKRRDLLIQKETVCVSRFIQTA